MKSYKYILYIVLALTACIVTGCQSEDLTAPGQETETVVSFRPELAADMNSRAIADGSQVNWVTAVAFYNGNEVIRKSVELKDAKEKGISLRLISGRTYNVLFWAQYAENGLGSEVYTIDEYGNVSVNYDNFLTGGFAEMEKLDAFATVQDVKVNGSENKSVTLTRAVAQLNFVDNTDAALDGATASLSLTGIATSINMLADTPQGVNTSGSVEFTFSDFPAEELDGNRYIASVYLLPTVKPITADYSISTGLEVEDITDIKLEANKRTNVIGAIVEAPVTVDTWDGITLSEPETQSVDGVNHYIIDACSDLAWLQVVENKDKLGAGTFVVTKDLDMNGETITPVTLPAGSTIEGADGKARTIKNLKINGGGVFGDATNLTVNNLTFDGVTASGVTHVGALVNILNGSSAFNNVIVNNATVKTTNGAAGGIVGYAVRKSEKDLGETFTLTLSNCTTDNVSITGTQSEGYFVGIFSGYDNGEMLTFTNCSKNNAPKVLTSHYSEGNEATWTAGTDFSAYNAYLGKEVYYRGVINYGAIRFIPAWDGKTKVVPLTDASEYKLIWSPFDLANIGGTNAGKVKLMANIDMEHDTDGVMTGTRKNTFTSLNTCSEFIGNGNTIYNCTISGRTYYDGFIYSCEGVAVTISDVTFDGTSIKVAHDAGTGNAYVGTVCPFIYGTLKATNVVCKNGYLYGVNKMGGLLGACMAGSNVTCTNCHVDNYYVENYTNGIKEAFLTFEFEAHGEVGGLIGFIQSNAAVSGCSVNNFTAKTYNEDASLKQFSRHTSEVIGDIRADNGSQITINCTVSGTNTFYDMDNGGKVSAFDTHAYNNKPIWQFWAKDDWIYYPYVGSVYKLSGSGEKVVLNGTTVKF